MAIDATTIPQPPEPLPEPPAPDDLEFEYRTLLGLRDAVAGHLEDPFYAPLRIGFDGQLARLYRAICGARSTGFSAVMDAAQREPLAADPFTDDWDGPFDAPAGAGDDVEAYRG